MRESKIERDYLKKGIEKLGGLCIKLCPDFFNGIPDRLVLMPGARIWFVETKAPGKKVKPGGIQDWVHKRLRELGFIVLVLDTKEKVDTFIHSILESEI